MIDPEIVQIVIQGGAVGLLLMFGVMGYRVCTMVVDRVSTFVNNHLEHNTKAVEEGTAVMREVAAEVRIMSEKMAPGEPHPNDTIRRVNDEGWELRD